MVRYVEDLQALKQVGDYCYSDDWGVLKIAFHNANEVGSNIFARTASMQVSTLRGASDENIERFTNSLFNMFKEKDFAPSKEIISSVLKGIRKDLG